MTAPSPTPDAALTEEQVAEWKADAERIKDNPPEYHGDADRTLALIADRARLTERLAEVEAERTAFTGRLGFGDNVTEPAATLAEMVDPIEQAFSEASEYHEGPRICEPCGEWLATATCEPCHGSGCGPGTATGAYEECEHCAGVGKVHPGCVGQSYADLAARAEAAEAERDDLRKRAVRVLIATGRHPLMTAADHTPSPATESEHDFLPVSGHPDDDECTHREDVLSPEAAELLSGIKAGDPEAVAKVHRLMDEDPLPILSPEEQAEVTRRTEEIARVRAQGAANGGGYFIGGATPTTTEERGIVSRYVPSADERAAMDALTLAGYAVVRQRTYDRLQERIRVAEQMQAWETDRRESTERWAHRECDEVRRLADRLNRVVAAAAALGGVDPRHQRCARWRARAGRGGRAMSADTLDCQLAYVHVNDYSGWALVLPGHGLDPQAVAAVATREDYTPHAAVEVFWQEHRRVKWCDRIDGFGCDNNGEWHRHWSEVKPNDNPSTHFTVVYRQEGGR